MPTIDLITAAGPRSGRFLPELADSIRRQHIPTGWSVRWLVVCDGPDARVNEKRAAFANALGAAAVWANHDRYWAGASRNRALAHSDAEFVQAVDADDVLCDEAVEAWVEAAARGTWCAFQMLDWYPESGTTVSFPSPFAEGPLTAGAWLEHFEQHGVHPSTPASILWPRETLLSVGGWGAGPSAEDAAVTLVGTSLQDGWNSHQAVMLYRQHAAQDTAGATRPVEPAAADARRLAVRVAKQHLTGRSVREAALQQLSEITPEPPPHHVYANQRNVFEVYCTDFRAAAALAAERQWWLHAWQWRTDADAPVVPVVRVLKDPLPGPYDAI